MMLHPSWADLGVRLLLTVVASGAIGWNRIGGGHAAGLRTTVLVGLAAAVAMIQANLLLGAEGRGPTSFSSMDVMRLPLGILTGVGFIGGGAILKRGELVVGLTTAATLWMVTVLGLCFGAGEVMLGAAVSVMAFMVLWLFRRLEAAIPRPHRALLTLSLAGTEPTATIEAVLRSHGFVLKPARLRIDRAADVTEAQYQLTWTGPERLDPTGDVGTALAAIGRLQSHELRFMAQH